MSLPRRCSKGPRNGSRAVRRTRVGSRAALGPRLTAATPSADWPRWFFWATRGCAILKRCCAGRHSARWRMREGSKVAPINSWTGAILSGRVAYSHLYTSSCQKRGNDALSTDKWLFNQSALQEYVLICCQHPGGGLIDKPGKARDYYHTCYCLSGLSVAQHFNRGKLTANKVIGDPENELKPTHPVYNIGLDAAYYALHHFKKQTPPEKL